MLFISWEKTLSLSLLICKFLEGRSLSVCWCGLAARFGGGGAACLCGGEGDLGRAGIAALGLCPVAGVLIHHKEWWFKKKIKKVKVCHTDQQSYELGLKQSCC